MSDQHVDQKKRIWTLAFTGFIFMSVVLCTGASVIIPVIPNIMRGYGVTSNFITVAFVTLLAGRFLSSIFTGYILKRFLPHQILFVSFLLHALTMTLLIYARNGIEFSILRFLEGIFEGIVSVILQVIVIGLSTPDNRGIKVGYMQSAFGFGFIIGPMLSTISMRLFGPSGVFEVVVVLILICLVWLMFLGKSIQQSMRDTRTQQKSFSLEFLKYLPYYGGPILQRVLMVAFSMLIPLFLVDRFMFAAHEVGIYFTISAIITTTTMPFTGRLGKSKYCNHIVTAAMVIMGLSIMGMSLTDSRAAFTACFVIETVGFAIMAPNAMKIFGDLVANHDRKSEIIGTSSGAREILNILIALCLIPIYDYNILLPWALLAALCILLSLPYVKINGSRVSVLLRN